MGRSLSRCRHHVVILDRTEPYFDDAIIAINARFPQNRFQDGCQMPALEAPVGGEILVFREALP